MCIQIIVPSLLYLFNSLLLSGTPSVNPSSFARHAAKSSFDSVYQSSSKNGVAIVTLGGVDDPRWELT
ncbi:hypothetical protein OUZ56_012797 [Daphnia magna]|uniref:Uncharacterized protein n=1 Tax=Daphnia magna TaxID=35525 RepID=A0ABQ9Z434_9CRUS|nr:hypothetical protein OUZ56_012797 [Daphnia magna]